MTNNPLINPGLSRRTFLRNSLGVAGALGFPTIIPPLRSARMAKPPPVNASSSA